MSQKYEDYNFPKTWGELTNTPAHEKAKELADSTDEKIEELHKDNGWRDLTDIRTYTVDPEDAKDYDDAIATKDDNILVIVARPDFYVEEGGIIEDRSIRRAITFYLEDEETGEDDTRHMLPPCLAQEACSLLKGEEKPAHVVEMAIEGGEVRNYDIYQAIVENDMQLSYRDVDELLENKLGNRLDDEVEEDLEYFDEITHQLMHNRWHTSLMLNQKSPSKRMIEELMIKANLQVGDYLIENDLPGVFRSHPGPVDNWLKEIEEGIRSKGYDKGGGWLKEDQSSAFSKLNRFMRKEVSDEDASEIRRVIITKLLRAKYVTSPANHFGLGEFGYLHFTSPIRRYPDLVNHRILAGNYLEGSGGTIEEVANQTTHQENKYKNWQQERNESV